MNFQIFGNDKAPTLLLIPGLGVSYEIFLPLIRLVEERFHIIAVEVDGFTLGKHTRFTSVDDQASQIVAKPQAKHLLSLYPKAHVEIFEGMNHGQLLVDHPEEIVQRIIQIWKWSYNRKK